jgi:hypothetical protein
LKYFRNIPFDTQAEAKRPEKRKEELDMNKIIDFWKKVAVLELVLLGGVLFGNEGVWAYNSYKVKAHGIYKSENSGAPIIVGIPTIPMERTNSIARPTTGKYYIFSCVEFSEVRGNHGIRWEWYNNRGRKVQTSSWTVSLDTKYWNRFSWVVTPNIGLGKYKVKIYINDQLIITDEFEITDDNPYRPPSVNLKSPRDGKKTDDTTPRFRWEVIPGSESRIINTFRIRNINTGALRFAHVGSRTNYTIPSNNPLPLGEYEWWVTVSDGTREVESEVWELTIKKQDLEIYLDIENINPDPAEYGDVIKVNYEVKPSCYVTSYIITPSGKEFNRGKSWISEGSHYWLHNTKNLKNIFIETGTYKIKMVGSRSGYRSDTDTKSFYFKAKPHELSLSIKSIKPDPAKFGDRITITFENDPACNVATKVINPAKEEKDYGRESYYAGTNEKKIPTSCAPDFYSHPGKYTVELTATLQGYAPVTKTDTFVLTGGDESPYVEILDPSDGDTVSGVVNIKVDAWEMENGSPVVVDKIEYYIDGDWKHTDYNPGATCPASDWDWNTRGYNGECEIKVKAYDNDEDTKEHQIKVTVNNQPNSLTLTVTPEEDQTRDWGGTVTYTIRVTDQNGSGVGNAEVPIEDNLMGLCASKTTNSRGYAYYTTKVPDKKPEDKYPIHFGPTKKDGCEPSEKVTRYVIVNHANDLIEIAEANKDETNPNEKYQIFNVKYEGTLYSVIVYYDKEKIDNYENNITSLVEAMANNPLMDVKVQASTDLVTYFNDIEDSITGSLVVDEDLNIIKNPTFNLFKVPAFWYTTHLFGFMDIFAENSLPNYPGRLFQIQELFTNLKLENMKYPNLENIIRKQQQKIDELIELDGYAHKSIKNKFPNVDQDRLASGIADSGLAILGAYLLPMKLGVKDPGKIANLIIETKSDDLVTLAKETIEKGNIDLESAILITPLVGNLYGGYVGGRKIGESLGEFIGQVMFGDYILGAASQASAMEVAEKWKKQWLTVKDGYYFSSFLDRVFDLELITLAHTYNFHLNKFRIATSGWLFFKLNGEASPLNRLILLFLGVDMNQLGSFMEQEKETMDRIKKWSNLIENKIRYKTKIANLLQSKQRKGIPVNHPPIAEAGTSQNVPYGTSVTLSARGSFDPDGTINRYKWTEKGVTLYEGKNVSFTKSDFSVGQHVVVLEVTDNKGAVSMDSTVIIVEDINPPVISSISSNLEEVVGGEYVTVNVNIQDEGGIEEIWLYIHNEDGPNSCKLWKPDEELDNQTNILWSIDWKTPSISTTDYRDFTYKIVVYASDKSGNINQSDKAITVITHPPIQLDVKPDKLDLGEIAVGKIVTKEKAFKVYNKGGGSFNWWIADKGLPSWLTLNPTRGHCGGADYVNVKVNTKGLDYSKEYSVDITFMGDNGAGSDSVELSFKTIEDHLPIPTRILFINNPNGKRGEEVILSGTLRAFPKVSPISGIPVKNRVLYFFVDNEEVGKGITDGSGKATFTYQIPPKMSVGNHPILVKFLGDSSYMASEGKGVLKVNPSGGIEDIMEDAKLIGRLETGAEVDLNGVVSTYGATIQGDYAVWEKELNEFIWKGSTYSGVAGDYTSQVKIRFAVDSNGTFYAGSIGSEAKEHLLIFACGSTEMVSNYRDFQGNLLDKSVYGEPHNTRLDLDVRQNYLGRILQMIYAELYKNNYITSGPKNYSELYNCTYALKNNFTNDITVIRSWIFHQQFDYGWYNELGRPIDEATNAKWSPIANNPDQNATLRRAFDLTYEGVLESCLWIYTSTDNGMYGDTTIFGMENPADYSTSGGSGSRTWSITYNAGANTYNVHNNNCASAQLYLMGQLPSRVEMRAYTTWSSVVLSSSIVTLGGDITTSNHTESPSPGDDNNPSPMKLVIQPGWNLPTSTRGVSIKAYPTAITVRPNEEAVYTLTITNTGKIQDTYNITYTHCKCPISIRLSQNEITIEPGKSDQVKLYSSSERVGDHKIFVTATSQADSKVKDTDTLITTVEEKPARTLIFDASPRIAWIKIDKKVYKPKDLPKTFRWSQNSIHFVEVPREVPEYVIQVYPPPPAPVYVFTKWSDGNKQTSRKIKVKEDARYTAFYELRGDDLKVKVISPNGGEIWSGTRDILWKGTLKTKPPTSGVYVYKMDQIIQYSPDAGKTWRILAELARVVSVVNSNELFTFQGRYPWDTTTVPDGKFYLIKVMVKVKDITKNIIITAKDQSDSVFTIDNTHLHLKIIKPTTQNPVEAGPYNDPQEISIIIEIGVPDGVEPTHLTDGHIRFFKVLIGGREAEIKSIEPLPRITSSAPTGIYRLIVDPPAQNNEGHYDLEVRFYPGEIWDGFKGIGWISDIQPKAVHYSDLPNAGSISGVVTKDGAPLEKVIIVVYQGYKVFFYAVTDENGYYKLEDLPFGKYTVAVVAPGYKVQTKEIELTQDDPRIEDVDFDLSGGNAPPQFVFGLTKDPLIERRLLVIIESNEKLSTYLSYEWSEGLGSGDLSPIGGTEREYALSLDLSSIPPGTDYLTLTVSGRDEEGLLGSDSLRLYVPDLSKIKAMVVAKVIPEIENNVRIERVIQGDGTKIDSPPGAFDRPGTIHLTRIKPDHGIPNLVSDFYLVELTGTNLVPGARLGLTLSYDPSKANDPNTLNIYQLIDDKWVLVNTNRSVDGGRHTIQAEVSSLEKTTSTNSKVINMFLKQVSGLRGLFGVFASPPSDTIEIRVNDTNAHPIKDAKIVVTKDGNVVALASTDQNGECTISGLSPLETYSVEASHRRYKTQKREGITPGTEVSFELIPAIPDTYVYPNPFRMYEKDYCIVKYDIPEDCHVSIKIYNIVGELIRELVDEDNTAGTYRIQWDGRNDDGDRVASGVYLYIFKAEGSDPIIKKIALIK